MVSFGEVRRFNLKRIQGGEGASSAEKRAQDAEPEHSFHVRNGDVVHMFADCQDKFLHSVSKAQGVRLLLAQSCSRFIGTPALHALLVSLPDTPFINRER